MIGMTKFLGPEYLIASAFLYLTRENFLSIKDTEEYRHKVQEYLNLHNINVVLTGRIDEYELRNFNNYFMVIDSANIVVRNGETSDDDLRYKFEYRIPIELSESFEIVAKEQSVA